MDLLRELALRGNVCSREQANLAKPCLKEQPCLKANPSLADFPTSDSLPELTRSDSKSSSSCAEPEEEPEFLWKSSLHMDIAACVSQAAATDQSLENFEFVKVLQPAARNKGRVELMRALNTGHFVAVKRMPVSWTTSSHEEFLAEHSREHEMPWVDVGLVKYLSSQGAPFLCKTFGVFLDKADVLVVSEFANKGDLFDWCQYGHAPGPDREIALRPIAQQMLFAVRYLHQRDIAHCDLSLENFLLSSIETAVGSSLKVKLIDFSMAAVGREYLVGVRGKASYEAPEMHQGRSYDPFSADVFALGVGIFLLASQDYPWKSTRPGGCPRFEFASTAGIRAYLKRRTVRRTIHGDRLSQVLSESLTELLEGLLQVQPLERASLESSVWQWLEQAPGIMSGSARHGQTCLSGFMSWIQAEC